MKNRDEMGCWRVKAELEWKDKNGKKWKMKRAYKIYSRIEMKKDEEIKWRNLFLRWKDQGRI